MKELLNDERVDDMFKKVSLPYEKLSINCSKDNGNFFSIINDNEVYKKYEKNK